MTSYLKKYWLILLLLLSFVSVVLFWMLKRESSKERPYKECSIEASVKECDIVFGDSDERNSVIMYFSYHCNYCRKFIEEVYPILDSLYIRKGQINLILRFVEFNQHPDVMDALQTVVCINRYGKLDKLHELLLFNPGVVFSEEFKKLISQYIVDNPNFAQCYLEHHDYNWLKSNNDEFYTLNSKGTPTFVINKHAYEGYYNYESFIEILSTEFNF